MSERNDGGNAFPVADYDHQTFQPATVDEHKRQLSGMTLRDYFAAKALPVAALRFSWRDEDGSTYVPIESHESLGIECYAIADMLLKARK